MVTPKGPKVLEYNVRFGDPEAQVILPLLEGDWGEVFKSVARGELMDLNWRPLYCSCVVLAAEGYPQTPVRGAIIEGQIKYQTPSSYFLHAGTALSANDEWITQGGRVLNAIGIGSTLKESVDLAYSQASKVSWVGMQLRKDIGARA